MSADKPDWNIGYTTRRHLCVDLDNTSYFKVRCLVEMIMQSYPDVGDCLIVLSSRKPQIEKYVIRNDKPFVKRVQQDNYHLIFNNFIDYEVSCYIIETLAHLGVLNGEYVRIREMRNDMTLRVSETVCVEYTKSAPTVVEYVENAYTKKEGAGIYLYNRLRKSILIR